MDRRDFLHRFQLDNDLFAHNQVDSITAIEFCAFVRDRDVDLLAKWNIAEYKFAARASLVSRFQKAGA